MEPLTYEYLKKEHYYEKFRWDVWYSRIFHDGWDIEIQAFVVRTRIMLEQDFNSLNELTNNERSE